MTRATARGFGALLLTAALSLAGAGAARAQSGRQWRPEERVLVTRFDDVFALASDLRNVYAATNGGLEVYDFVGRRWGPPVTVEDGFPVGERPTALAYDRFHDDVWMTTSTGAIYTYDVGFGTWSWKATTPQAPISRIAMDPGSSGDIYFAGPTGWLRLRQGSLLLEPVPPGQEPPGLGRSGPGARALVQSDPYLRSALGTLSLDERGRRWPVTSIIPGDVPATYWVGTDGGNLALFDSRTTQTSWLRYGVPSFGIGALAADGKDLWFGGDGRGPGRGVTLASADLQTWRTWDAERDGAPAEAIAAVLPAGAAVWFAAADGLYRLDRVRGRFERLEERDGLPSSNVGALAPAGGGVWAGTRRGLVLIGDDGRARTPNLLFGRAVHHLAMAGDTLWVSSDAGLWVLPDASRAGNAGAGPGATDRAGAGAPRPAPMPIEDSARAYEPRPRPPAPPTLEPAPGTESLAALRGRVLAAQIGAGAVYAVTPDALYRYDGANWLVIRDPTLASIGRPTGLAIAGESVWVAGQRGIARLDTRSALWTSYTVGPDLPAGPVWAVLPAGDDVWAATPAGAMRLRWRR